MLAFYLCDRALKVAAFDTFFSGPSYVTADSPRRLYEQLFNRESCVKRRRTNTIDMCIAQMDKASVSQLIIRIHSTLCQAAAFYARVVDFATC